MRLDSLRQNISQTRSSCMELISICSSSDEKVGGLANSIFRSFQSTARNILGGGNLPRYLRDYRMSLRSTIIRLSGLISALERVCITIKYRVITKLFGRRFKVFEKMFNFKGQIKAICSQIKSACRRYITRASRALNKLR